MNYLLLVDFLSILKSDSVYEILICSVNYHIMTHKSII